MIRLHYSIINFNFPDSTSTSNIIYSEYTDIISTHQGTSDTCNETSYIQITIETIEGGRNV